MKKHVALSVILVLVMAPVLLIWGRNDDSEITCLSPDGNNAVCGSGEIQDLKAKAWGAYVANSRGRTSDIKYYIFKIKRETPKKGQLVITISPNNVLLEKERHQIMFGGGAWYIYDVEKEKIIDERYSK